MTNKDYQVTEDELRHVFSYYGEITYVRIIKNLEGKPEGYAFIEFKHKSDFLMAYREGSNSTIRKRKVTVDAEYARTNESFRPKRLCGGFPHRPYNNNPFKR